MTAAHELEQLRFLEAEQVERIVREYGTPVYVYSREVLRRQAAAVLAFGAPYGLTVRYAMKANPNRAILQEFDRLGLEIDASSGYESWRALAAGVAPEKILLTAQELPKDLARLVKQGVQFTACSLRQLRAYGELFPDTAVSVRLNPGLGSGHSQKVSVGGTASGFGIWHEYLDEVKRLAQTYDLRIVRLHTHIGSGTGPEVWAATADISLALAAALPAVEILNLGGGFKVAQLRSELGIDLQLVGAAVGHRLAGFCQRSGRELHLEIEPGTLLVAGAGCLIATVDDVADTGQGGYEFLKLDAGMTEILRPTLYGAQHAMVVVGARSGHREYVVVGHCCESSDLLTTCRGDPEAISPRLLQEAQIGDQLVVEGTGAYCAAMSAAGYNSFPLAPEVMLEPDGRTTLMRRRQTLDELTALER